MAGNTEASRRKILLIGWDAADWRVIHPLLDAGKMPALESMIDVGVMGNLATIRPVLSPMLWTSIATGKRAYKHGIHGFAEPTADGTGIQPITNLSRKCKAFWNIFHQSGMRGHVVGWWPSSPAEPILGSMVSNHYQQFFSHDPAKPWPVRPGTVHPKRLEPQLKRLRFHGGELAPEQVIPFVPYADEIDQDQDRRLGALLKIIGECTSVHAAATFLVRHKPWDYAAVYYDAIDHFGHGFMKYHPPRQSHVSESDFRLYSNVVEAGYRYHDMMLSTWLQLIDEDTTVVLISDHGFHPDHLRVASIPREPAAPAVEHRDFGIFVMKGPGVRRDERIYGASVLDVCPTLLALAGLPVARDMDGKPLLRAWQQSPEIEVIDSWEDVPGDAGQHPADTKLDPRESQQALEQLVELGYIDQPDENKQVAIEQTTRELNFNLAQSLMDADRHQDAAEILEQLFEKKPEDTRFGMRLALCYRALDRITELKPLIEKMRARRVEFAEDAARRLVELVKEILERPASEGDDGAGAAEAGVSTEAESKNAQRTDDSPVKEDQPLEETVASLQQEGDEERTGGRLERAFERANQREKTRIRQLFSDAQAVHYSFDYLQGYALLAEGYVEEALQHFQNAEKFQGDNPWLLIQIGEGYLQMKRWEDAERNYRRALEVDSENPYAFAGLSRSFLGRRMNLKAAEAALEAVGLLYHYPYAHYLLGIALHRAGRLERAIQALEVAVAFNPNFLEAHQRLVYIYEQRLKNPEKAAYHRKMSQQIQSLTPRQRSMPKPIVDVAHEDTGSPQAWDTIVSEVIPDRWALAPGLDRSQVITVVTGLPRSGTSMMMQMLEAGGIPAMTDGARSADENNPRGYYEQQQVKQLRHDSSWMPHAKGKAVKIIAQLIPHLPKERYRVIFMDRNLDEVIASQRRMLDDAGKKGGQLPDERLKQVFAKHIRIVGTMLNKSKIPVLRVSHRQCIDEPGRVAADVNRFLGGDLQEAAMSAAVDSRLYRQRKSV